MTYKTTAILLAGGSGSRMQTSTPKQFLPLGDKPIVLHSFQIFLQMTEIDEIVVVCSPTYRHHFLQHQSAKPITFALPGHRRQDSVYNGLLAASPTHDYICVHDGARPFIDIPLVQKVLHDAQKYGAATAAVPIKFTVKETDPHGFVVATPDREKIWEIQTPQIIQHQILLKGFQKANSQEQTVTDDVSLAELIGHKVKLTLGYHTNLKITVPTDLTIAHQILQQTTP